MLHVAGSLADQILLQIPVEILLVGGFDEGDLGVGPGSQNLDQTTFNR